MPSLGFVVGGLGKCQTVEGVTGKLPATRLGAVLYIENRTLRYNVNVLYAQTDYRMQYNTLYRVLLVQQ